MEGALQFPRGNIYTIVCKAGDQALRIAQNDISKFYKSRVTGTQHNSNDNGQLFMIEKVTHKDDGFQIVNCVSSLVFDEESDEVRLKEGSQNSDQLFGVVPAPVQGFHQYYWIKTSSKGDKALALEGILRVKNFDPNNQNQLFRFEMAGGNYSINNSAILVNKQSGKALDVPGASFKKEERLIQWEKNKRFNQRFNFIQNGKGVIIQSLLNGYVLDVAGQSKKAGSKVILWDKTGNANQTWIPEGQNGVYRFRAAHEPSLFLCIDDSSVKDGAKVEVHNQDNPSMYWIIQGKQPF